MSDQDYCPFLSCYQFLPCRTHQPLHSEFPALKNDLILRAARGEVVDRAPVWCHRQAGRYLPEFRQTRTLGDFFTICRTPVLACEITLQPIRRYPELDAAIIFSDILVVPQAMGLECLMLPGKGPSFPRPLSDPSHLSRLLPPDQICVEESLGYVFEAITLTRHKLEGSVPLLGFCGAPWTLMAYMVEGEGSKSYNDARAWLFHSPAAAHELLQRITDVTIKYLVGQVVAGAQMLEVFDSWAGDLSPESFMTFAFEPLQKIAREVKKTLRDKGYEAVPMTIFAKGASYPLLEQLAQNTEYDVLAVDWTISPELGRGLTKFGKSVQGNLDPAILFADHDTIRKETRKMIQGFGIQRYVVNLGHGMLPSHNPDHLKVFLQEVHACH